MKHHPRIPALLVAFASLVHCSVYEGGLGGDGGGADDDTASSVGSRAASGSTGEGGAVGCSAPSECPGDDGECGTRTCEGNVCGLSVVDAGTPIQTQVLGDCKRQICDGLGAVVTEPDDTDVLDDGNGCTHDACSAGQITHVPEMAGFGCTDGGGSYCNGMGACVACVDGSHCPSGVCNDTGACSPASCNDMQVNGEETDLNCGGSQCPGCAIGQSCDDGGDCAGGVCAGMQCQPSCDDGLVNQDETDVDCGGSCVPCGFGFGCDLDEDCTTASCNGTTCGPIEILVSEVRTRGVGAGDDEMIELYNPGNLPLTLTPDVHLRSRSKTSQNYTVKWTAAGQVIPPRSHLLLVGAAYAGAVAGDATLADSIPDEISLVLEQGMTVVDAVCFHCGMTGFDATYTCEGAPFVKTGCTTNVDRSLERKPGAAQGNGQDTGDSATDFQVTTPSNPQNLAAAPAP